MRRLVGRRDGDGAGDELLERDVEEDGHQPQPPRDGDEEGDEDARDDGGGGAHLDPAHADGGEHEARERHPGDREEVEAVRDQDRHRALERAVRPLQREAVAEDDAERRDAQHVERERHRRRAEDEVHRRQQPVRPLRHLELDEALEREAGDHRRLRRQVRVPLHVELELALPQPERVPLDAGEEELLVRLEHLCSAAVENCVAAAAICGGCEVCGGCVRTACGASKRASTAVRSAGLPADAISVGATAEEIATAEDAHRPPAPRGCSRGGDLQHRLASSCWKFACVLENRLLNMSAAARALHRCRAHKATEAGPHGWLRTVRSVRTTTGG